MLVKLRAPLGASSLSVNGRTLNVDYDGSVEVSELEAIDLRSHGFVDWDGPPQESTDLDALSYEQLVGLAVAKAREHIESLDHAALLSSLKQDLDDKNAAAIDAVQLPDEMSDKRIMGMNRIELFAYLKANGVSAPPPIGNERLREIALQTFVASKAPQEPAPVANASGAQAGTETTGTQ